MSSNMFIKIGEVKGSGLSAAHMGEIEILSWSHSFNQPTSPTRTSAGSGTVEKAHHSDLSFTKYMDDASTELLKHCWSGKHYDEVTLTCYRADGDEQGKPLKYLEVKMLEVIISNISVGGSEGDIPIENVSLNYGEITYTYVPQESLGKASGNTL